MNLNISLEEANKIRNTFKDFTGRFPNKTDLENGIYEKFIREDYETLAT